MLLPRAPKGAATLALSLGPVAYGGLMVIQGVVWGSRAFLNAAGGAFVFCCALMVAGTVWFPMKEARVLPVKHDIDLRPSAGAKYLGFAVIGLTILLYVVFW
jgi:hypothetical protein